MKLLNHTDRWDNSDGPTIFDLLRIFLGVALFAKGLEFIRFNQAVSDVIEQSGLLPFLPSNHVMLYIVIGHLLCGLLIIVGLCTRLSCLLMLPVLIGAFVITVQQNNRVLIPYSDLWIVVTMNILLLFFLLEGAGAFSLWESLHAKRQH
ncbi:DoxX family protein [Deminuibacter soli]|uniref:DoxX family protein n=1 Tax=Deminuibacter soli TaxID=2291815 RepID=A0A3E1NDT3_9BACT|nr:DoxX family protein [Deminuibacter soli]RFM26116.1 DoxX family protein [Deminuibacter soli]